MAGKSIDRVRAIMAAAEERIAGITDPCQRPNDMTDFVIEEIDPPLAEDIGPEAEHPEEELRKEIASWIGFQAAIDWDEPALADGITAALMSAIHETGAVLLHMTHIGYEHVKGNAFGTVPLYYLKCCCCEKQYWAAIIFCWGD